MWLLFARAPPPDAPYWPGRRLLAAIDAAAWPLMWVFVASQAPKSIGLVGQFVAALALLCAFDRLHRAIWVNHRYRFTTCYWGWIVSALLLSGAMLKLTVPA